MRYNRRILFASFLYVIGLGGALMLFRDSQVSKPSRGAAVADADAAGVRHHLGDGALYHRGKRQEYLRARTVNAALVATGLLLAIATFWGFLTTFGVAPDVPMWAAVPVWCFGLGIGQFVGKVRGT